MLFRIVLLVVHVLRRFFVVVLCFLPHLCDVFDNLNSSHGTALAVLQRSTDPSLCHQSQVPGHTDCCSLYVLNVDMAFLSRMLMVALMG